MATKDCGFIQEVIMKNLNIQRECGRFCDIRLSIGKQFTWIHSAVMCSLSPYINRECCNAVRLPKIGTYKTFSFNAPLSIKLNKDNNLDCFKCLRTLIDIIYGQKTAFDAVHLPHVHALCKFLSFSDVIVKLISNKLQYGDIENSNTEIAHQNEDSSWKTDAKISNDINKNSQTVCADVVVLKTDTTLKRRCEKFSKRYIGKIKPSLNVSDLKVLSGKMQTCIGCQYKCYKPSDLLTHLRSTGHGDKICSLCFAKMESIDDLNEHFILHDDPKPFFCTFCDVRFQTRTLLSAHLPRHSSETPYSCPHCKKGFKWKHGLNSHLITHSNEKKHLCDECGFSTTHAKTLRAHKLTHTGELFRCSHPGCAHTSSRKENMKIHLGTHNKDKPFVCEVCGHKFTQNKSLKRHALIHGEGGLVNICPHCPFKALRTDNLKAHVLRQHTEKPLQLELSDSFAEAIIINVEPDMVSIIKSNDDDFHVICKDENDLSVLADAASSRTKIQNPSFSPGLIVITDGSLLSRNFDNLIANPMLPSPDQLIKIEGIDIMFDEGNVPQEES